jgi:hypothetical protein
MCYMMYGFIGLILGSVRDLVPVRVLTEHHVIKAYWGVELYLHTFYDLGTRWKSK